VDAGQRDGLVTDDAFRAIGRCRVEPACLHVRLGPRDEEGAGLVQDIEPREVDITAIHDVDRTGLGKQQIKDVHVVQLAVRDVDEGWNAAPQVEQGMHLHRRLGRAEMRPGKDRQAQVDGRRVERVHGFVKIEPQAVADVEPSGLSDQPLSEVGMDAPVACLVGVRQRRAPHGLAKAHVVELGGLRREAGLDVAQALAIGELGERHRPVLLGAGQRADPAVTVVAHDQPRERAPRQKVHELREQRLAGVHGRLPATTRGTVPARRSSRHHASKLKIPCILGTSKCPPFV